MRGLVVFLLLVGLGFCPAVWAQTVSGYVFNEKGEPLPGVSVYVSGTTLGTDTDAEGRFSLSYKDVLQAVLVFTKLGYQSNYLVDVAGITDLQVTLQPKYIEIEEVAIEGIFTRKQLLKLFKARFLGVDIAGKMCNIKNESELVLSYDYADSRLSVVSRQPLMIVNRYLGYTLQVDLDEFYAISKSNSIDPRNVVSDYYKATVFFVDDKNGKQPYGYRRERSYLGSQMHFFRTLWKDQFLADQFLLLDGTHLVNPDSVFGVSDTLNMKRVKIRASTNNPVTMDSKGYLYAVIPSAGEPIHATYTLIYRKKQSSLCVFRTSDFLIDSYGNHSAADKIQFDGEMASRRVGNLLPFNYWMEEAIIPVIDEK